MTEKNKERSKDPQDLLRARNRALVWFIAAFVLVFYILGMYRIKFG